MATPIMQKNDTENMMPLREVLCSLSDKKFIFVRPGGNWGDHLIYLGAECLASQLGLNWESASIESLRPECIEEGAVILLQGGGGFTKMASGRAMKCLKAALKVPDAIIIQAPCTVDDSYDTGILREMISHMQAQRLFFFAREPRTLEIIRPILSDEMILLLNEDTAFYVEPKVLLERASDISRRINLLAVREDTEAIAVSNMVPFDGVSLDPAVYARSFDHWIRIHAAARTLVTNRTHSAICGAILGVPTTMFPGAYHKNRSIWEFSLKNRNVTWLSEDENIPYRSKIEPLLRWAPDRIQNSWRVSRFMYRLRGVPGE